MRPSVNLRTRQRRHREQRGMALVMVLLAIVVLTVFLTEVQEESSTSLASAIAARDRLRAEYHARSAVNLARLLIAVEPTVRRAIAPMFQLLNPKSKAPQIPVWEFSDQVLGIYNGGEGKGNFATLANVDTSSAENVGLGTDGHFELAIVDEDSKININTAARGDVISAQRVASQLMGLMVGPQYDPLFDGQDADGQTTDRATLCGAIIDWADFNEEREPCALTAEAVNAGAEDNFYQSIGLDYFRKNAAFDSLEELRLVRGVSDEIWRTFVDPDPRKPDKRIVTVWGQGKINVNTANAQTLWALVCGPAGAPDATLCLDPTQAAGFISTVSLVRGFTMGAPLFGSSKDFVLTLKGGGMVGPYLQAVGVQPVTFKSESEMRRMVTTKSKMFSIYAEGVVPGRRRETRVSIHAVIDFRHAVDPNQVVAAGLAAQLGVGAPKTPHGGNDEAKQDSSGGQLDPESMAAALASSPAGNVVYWRVQ